jgi:glycosyltransferase involved in cell wall biosynthesis
VTADLSVIVPAYQAASTIARAISSILAVEPDAEVVVVDDGSTDGTGAVAASLGAQVRVVPRPGPSGASAARNHGLVVANRPLIGFLDADDEWCSHRPDPRLTLLRARPDVGLAIGHTQATVPGESGPDALGEPFLLLTPHAAIVRRSVLPRIGAFAEDLPGGEDLDWGLRARDAGIGFEVLPTPVLTYRMGPATLSSDPADRRRNLLLAMRRAVLRKRDDHPSASAPTVSVVLPVRDAGVRVEECLDSISAQTVPVLEVVVVENGSSDDTADRVKARAAKDPRIRFVDRSTSPHGDAYNTGIGLARGDVVCFLAHDDAWLPDTVASLLDALAGPPPADYAHGRVRFEADPDEPDGPGLRTELVGQVRATRLPECLAARRELFATLGGFRTDLSSSADVDWHARAMDAGIAHAQTDQVVAVRRLRATSASVTAPGATDGLLRALHESIERRRGGS